MNRQSQAAELLRIVGAEDFSNDGASGVVTVEGDLGNAIMRIIFPLDSARAPFENKPVKVSRSGGLEIWCNGFYTEGKGVRRIVHSAVRSLGQSVPVAPGETSVQDDSRPKGRAAP